MRSRCMCTHSVMHPIVAYDALALAGLAGTAIIWKASAPTPRPGTRFLAAWAVLFTFVFGTLGARDWLDLYRTAIGGSVMLVGALLVELIAAETAVVLPRARIVS